MILSRCLTGSQVKHIIFHDVFLDGNDLIENAIAAYYADASEEKPAAVLYAIRQRMHEDGHFIISVIVNEDDENQFTFRTIQTNDGSFLKKAIEICNRYRTQLNLIKLARILRDSFVWVPFNMIMSDEDYETLSKAVLDAADKGEIDSIIGQEFTAHDNIRMVPDILQNGDNFFFPVFTSDEEIGEYGEHFSKIQSHFLEAMNLARNNDKNVCGIVMNAFSESFVIPIELFDIIAEMDPNIERKE